MTLRRSLLYLLIFTTVGSFFTYRIVVRAYSNVGAGYDIEKLK